jgi:hypothetical protein
VQQWHCQVRQEVSHFRCLVVRLLELPHHRLAFLRLPQAVSGSWEERHLTAGLPQCFAAVRRRVVRSLGAACTAVGCTAAAARTAGSSVRQSLERKMKVQAVRRGVVVVRKAAVQEEVLRGGGRYHGEDAHLQSHSCRVCHCICHALELDLGYPMLVLGFSTDCSHSLPRMHTL